MKAGRLLYLLLAAALWAQQPVEVARVVSKNVERKLRLPGEFQPYWKVDLFARVMGFVEKVNVDRGSMVRKGQLLAVLSAPELTAQLAEANAKVQTVESQLAEAQAKLVAAESTYERLKAASATPGTVAEIEVVVARQSMDAARATVLAFEASKRAAQDAARAVRELQGYLNVTAPFDGIVTTRYVDPGALVGPGSGSSATPLLRLEHNAVLRLVVSVPEKDVGGIVKGARVPFTVPAHPGETFYGVVSRIAGSIDLKTRTMPVELDTQNGEGRLAPGMYPQVIWPVRRSTASLLVPPTSIVTTTERTFVIRVQNGRAEYVDVVRGAPAGDMVEVFGPLRPNDEIIRRGTDEIREGTPLTTRAAQERP